MGGGLGPLILNDETPTSGPPLGEVGGGLYGMTAKTADDPPYTITLVVEPVPEPSSLMLLVSVSLGA